MKPETCKNCYFGTSFNKHGISGVWCSSKRFLFTTIDPCDAWRKRELNMNKIIFKLLWTIFYELVIFLIVGLVMSYMWFDILIVVLIIGTFIYNVVLSDRNMYP